MTRPTDALREAFSVYWRDARDGCEPDQEEMLKAWASDAFKAGVKAALSESRWIKCSERLPMPDSRSDALQLVKELRFTMNDCPPSYRILLHKAADYIESLPSESRWIKSSERLPTNEESVLTYFAQTDTIHVLWMDPTEQMWFDPSDPDGPFSTHSSGYLTHWMPLPASPACNVGEEKQR